MAVQADLLSSHSVKTLGAMKAERTVKRATHNPNAANPGSILYVTVPKLHPEEVIVPGTLALLFNLDLKLTGGHADNYLVQNVSRALISRFVVKYAGETVQDTHGYDIYEIFKDLFLTVDEREEMLLEGIQSTKLNKIRSDAGNKETSGVDTEKALENVYKNKYKINLDHEILTDHGVFYPQALLHNLAFELTLAPASQVVRGSDATKLVYKLKNIQLEYEVIRSKTLSDDATSAYRSGKEFAYDFVMREQVVGVNRGEDSWLNIRVNPQRRSLKGLLLLFTAPYTLGARDSEHYENPNITKVHVTINGVPNRVYNERIKGIDMWRETNRFFGTKSKKRSGANGRPNMTLAKYLADNKLGLWIDLRSMADTTLHGSGQRLVNTQDGIQLTIERNPTGSGTVKCHIFSISDSQMNIQSKQLHSVLY